MAIKTPDWVKTVSVPTYKRNYKSAEYTPGSRLTDKTVFKVSLSASEFSQNLKTLAETEPGFMQYIRNKDGEWSGLRGKETPESMVSDTVSNSALLDLQMAKGKIDKPLIAGTINLKPTGSSYSMARVIMGHPIAAFRREKTKLPPLTINLTLQVSASVNHSAVSASLAKIIRAAWEYKLAGGIVSLKMNFFSNFSRPNGESQGLWTVLTLPLANMATIATYAGVQGYRVSQLSLAQSLSGKPGDILPVADTPLIPGSYPLTGVPENDNRILAALKVR